MDLFQLPHSAKVNKVIPKNAFDTYTTSKQKKLFTDLVARITWLYKLSPDTVNLAAKEIKEIQIFKIELKVSGEIYSLLDIIDRAIPYNIIFIVEFEDMVYFSTSTKHTHPLNENNAVIDWTFKSSWFSAHQNKYPLNLKKNLDAVFHDFCIQLSDKPDMESKQLQHLVQYKRETEQIEKEIFRLENKIKSAKQFKEKVELNMLLIQKRSELKLLDS